jgi:hypothetical protein
MEDLDFTTHTGGLHEDLTPDSITVSDPFCQVDLARSNKPRLGGQEPGTRHSGEHYGQLVVYCRMAGLVPPESRPKKK